MLLLTLAPASVAAETLRGALLKAYRANPDLTAARARLRAIDENVAIARSFGRPQVSGSASVVQDYDGSAGFATGDGR